MEGNKQHIGHLGHTAKHSNTHTHTSWDSLKEKRERKEMGLWEEVTPRSSQTLV